MKPNQASFSYTIKLANKNQGFFEKNLNFYILILLHADADLLLGLFWN